GDIDIRCEASIVWSAVVNQALIGKWESATARAAHVEERLRSLDFLAVADVVLSETAAQPLVLALGLPEHEAAARTLRAHLGVRLAPLRA
ncbi:hypothetical protein, partial [Streptomyces bambusae]